MIKLSDFELNSLIDIYQDALDTLTKARDEYWHSEEDLVRFDKNISALDSRIELLSRELNTL
uniref:Uncharacterized protein n=1 Tax=Siphoviridae sp. ctMsr1 TaxID=2826264 RepID=A0A8S5LV50_9CAUD|nr:MAG TPA: hypothetical protein [Siphoviridae sp. ctMsr1]